MIKVFKEPIEEAIHDYSVPLFVQLLDLMCVICPCVLYQHCQYKSLFRMSPGSTTVAEYFIPTSGTPVKVPQHRIPANYCLEVEKQIQLDHAQGGHN